MLRSDAQPIKHTDSAAARGSQPAKLHSLTIRGQKVILDADLAAIYGVSTKRLNEQVKRNADRFPRDFAFQLTPSEWAKVKSQAAEPPDNRSQIATGSQKHRDPRFPPQAFTEHGAIMAATVLNSPRAVQMSVFVVRAFVKSGLRSRTTGTWPANWPLWKPNSRTAWTFMRSPSWRFSSA